MKKENIEKIKTGVIVVLILVIVFGASYFASELEQDNKGNDKTTASEKTTNNNESSSDINEDEQSDLNNIDIDEYLKLLKADKASIIYIARPTCHYCQQEEPIIKNIVYEHDVTVNYLNTDELDEEDQGKLINSNDYFSEGYGTPILLVVKDNDIVDKLEGLTTKENIISFFKEHGFIDE